MHCLYILFTELAVCFVYLARTHGLHQTDGSFELLVSLAFDVGAQLRALETELVKGGRSDNGARECGADDAVEYVGVGIDDGVADVEHVQR